MRKGACLAVAAAMAMGLSSPGLGAEILTVRFDTPTGGVTTGLYSGQVRIKTSGLGVIWPGRTSDTFYFLDSPNVAYNPYQLTFDTAPIPGLATTRQAYNFIVGGQPVYSPTHTYNFVLNTGASTPTKLYFGMWDGLFDDNSGSVQLEVSALSSAVPEPAAWAMMLGGFAVVGAATRRRAQVPLVSA